MPHAAILHSTIGMSPELAAYTERLDSRIAYTSNRLAGIRPCSYASMIIGDICWDFHNTGGRVVDISPAVLAKSVGAPLSSAIKGRKLLITLGWLEVTSDLAWGWPSFATQESYAEAPIAPLSIPASMPKAVRVPKPPKQPAVPKDGFVYLMLNKRNGYYKIGFSTQPNQREKTLQAEEPEVEMLACFAGTTADERALHTQFADKRLRGEWFALMPTDLSLILAY